MKIFLRILFWIAIAVLVIAAIGFLFPSKAHVERSITINAKPDAVYTFLIDLGNFNKWSPWYEGDTAAKYSYEGPSKGIGSIMHWDSKKLGKGWLKMTEAVPNDIIKYDLSVMEERTAFSS